MTCFSPSHYDVGGKLIVPIEDNKIIGPCFLSSPIFISGDPGLNKQMQSQHFVPVRFVNYNLSVFNGLRYFASETMS